jgi:hypothetical protein
MSSIYKFLNVDNHQVVSDELYNFVLSHPKLWDSEEKFFFYHLDVAEVLVHTPLLQKFLSEKFLHPTVMGIVITHADSPSNLHVDYVDENTTSYIRMLWPVRNCHGSKTVFRNVPAESMELVEQPDGKRYYNIPTDQHWDCLGEFELTAPVLFNVVVPHEIVPAPNATQHRISCSIGFDRDLAISKSFDAWNGF